MTLEIPRIAALNITNCSFEARYGTRMPWIDGECVRWETPAGGSMTLAMGSELDGLFVADLAPKGSHYRPVTPRFGIIGKMLRHLLGVDERVIEITSPDGSRRRV